MLIEYIMEHMNEYVVGKTYSINVKDTGNILLVEATLAGIDKNENYGTYRLYFKNPKYTVLSNALNAKYPGFLKNAQRSFFFQNYQGYVDKPSGMNMVTDNQNYINADWPVLVANGGRRKTGRRRTGRRKSARKRSYRRR